MKQVKNYIFFLTSIYHTTVGCYLCQFFYSNSCYL